VVIDMKPGVLTLRNVTASRKPGIDVLPLHRDRELLAPDGLPGDEYRHIGDAIVRSGEFAMPEANTERVPLVHSEQEWLLDRHERAELSHDREDCLKVQFFNDHTLLGVARERFAGLVNEGTLDLHGQP
jgi:hypothetical protein